MGTPSTGSVQRTSPARTVTKTSLSEDYARTLSSENYDKNPFSKESDRNLLCENYTNGDKKTEEEVQFTMTAIPGDQIYELERPYLGLDSYQHEF